VQALSIARMFASVGLVHRVALASVVISLMVVAAGCTGQLRPTHQAPPNTQTVNLLLRWRAPNQSDIAGYRVYRGSASHEYGPPLNVGVLAKATFDGVVYYVYPKVPLGRWYFALKTYNAAGAESEYSNEKVIDITSAIPPQADAGPNQTGNVGDVFILGAAPAKEASYFWTQTAGPPVKLSNRLGSRTQFSAAEAGTYRFDLVAYDAQGVAAEAMVDVVVKSP